MALNMILMVDDDAEDRLLVKTAFDELGYVNSISFAENGLKALDILKNALSGNENMPKLLVLDLNMPKLSGTEVLKLLKQNDGYKNINVVIFSTALNDPEKEKCLGYGATDYIVKPFNYTGFLETAQMFYEISSMAS